MPESISRTTLRWSARVTCGLGLTGALAAAHPAAAQITDVGNIEFSTSMSSLPSNDAVSTVSFGSSASTGLISNAAIIEGSGSEAATISFSGTSGLYSGSTSGVSAAPFTTSGPATNEYLVAQPKGAVTISYASQQQYFGLLWGSVDSYNTLTFYNGSQEVGQLTGSAITTNANGDKGASGSYFVNANFIGVTYNTVVATSTIPAFEFGLISASQTVQNISPAPIALPGATPGGLLVLLAGVAWRMRQRPPHPSPQH